MNILQIALFVLVLVAIYLFAGMVVGYARQNERTDDGFSWRLALRTIPIWPLVVVIGLIESFKNPRKYGEYEQ